MSAIAGILWFDPAASRPGQVSTLTSAMRTFGPDEQTHWSGHGVELGHCMLRTTPESLHERQPVVSENALVALVWDGRLDNRAELQAALASAGRSPRGPCDGELVLQSYLAWGTGCVERFLGDFALAIWDAGKDELFCARDPMGARPLFFTRTGDFFAFASDDETLALLPGVSQALSDKHIAYFLVPTYRGFDSTHSWLEKIEAVSAAQTLSIARNGRLSKNTYWKLEPAAEACYASDAECEEAFRQVFTQAVRCRMRSIGDIAVMASGGLDSASILATASELVAAMPGKSLHSYSALSDQPETCVESQCILSMTAALGANAHRLNVPSFTGMLDVADLVRTAWSEPHPVDNSILLPAMMCLAAARGGHRVLLTGVCGDLTTHAGHGYIATLLKTGNWRQAWLECKASTRRNPNLQGTVPAWIFLKSLYHCGAPLAMKRVARKLRSLLREPFDRAIPISPGFAREMGLEAWHRASYSRAAPFLTDIQSAHILSLQPPHGLASSMGGYNRAAGKYGVELRDPWADRRVVEFWVRLPLKYKFRNGWIKYLVRSTFESALPANVAWRAGKEHIGWNFFYRAMDEIDASLPTMLKDGLRPVESFVDIAAAQRCHTSWTERKTHIDRERLFDVLTLASWVRRKRTSR
jgi:asparagine synthase (glutamine-hydrolysing)